MEKNKNEEEIQKKCNKISQAYQAHSHTTGAWFLELFIYTVQLDAAQIMTFIFFLYIFSITLFSLINIYQLIKFMFLKINNFEIQNKIIIIGI